MRSLLPYAAALLLALGGADAASAEVKVGDQVPAIDDGKYFNAEGLDQDALRGKVVLLQLFHSKSQACKDQVKHLNGLLETYGPKGLVVIATSYEPAADVEAFVAETEAKYVVIGECAETENVFGLKKGHPTSFVFDVNGKVVWKDNWADKSVISIEIALKGVTVRPWVPPVYKDIAALVDGKSYAQAGEALRTKLAEKELDARHKVRLEALYAYLRDAGKADLETAKKLVADGAYWKARNALRTVAEDLAGLPVGAEAAEALAALLVDKKAKKEIAARDFYEETMVAIAKLVKEDPTNAKPVIKLLKKVVRKFKGTAAAKRAQKKLDRIE